MLRVYAKVILLLILSAAGLAAPLAADSSCTGLRNEQIQWIVPTRPGGGYDRYSRLIQPFLEQSLQARVVIRNRPEAGGIVGANEVSKARPDGRTIGIINGPGLLAAHTLLNNRAPNPASDFSLLARVVGNHMAVFTGGRSDIDDVRVLLQTSSSRPVVIGVRDVGSASFFAAPVTALLLGMDYSAVTGYVGSTSRVMAVIRGEVDIIIQNYDSVSRYVDSGELKPLLLLTDRAVPGGTGVPRLTGTNGLAAIIAEQHGADAKQAVSHAQALSALMSTGRLIVGPPDLPAGIMACLQDRMSRILNSGQFRAAAADAGLGIEPADAATVQQDLLHSLEILDDFAPAVRSAVERARL